MYASLYLVAPYADIPNLCIAEEKKSGYKEEYGNAVITNKSVEYQICDWLSSVSTVMQ